MEMQFKNEIKKLADIVVWADALITAGGYNDEKYRDDAASAYCHVKAYELWKIKTVVLEAIDRHTTYTNALNKDIADKAAKIDLLEKEIEGRKEGYYNLKDRLDTARESINHWKNEHAKVQEENERLNIYNRNLETANNNLVTRVASLETEIEGRKEGYVALKTQMDVALANKDEKAKELINISTKEISELKKELADCKVKIKHQKENLDGINKTLEIRTKENERLVTVKNNQDREIEAHEAENARLSEKIMKLNDTITELAHDIDNYKSWNADLHRDIKSEINGKNDLVDAYEKKYDEFEKKIAELKRQNEYLTEELNDSYKAWDTDSKNHQKRDMTLVDELAKKNKEIEKLKVDLIHEREKNEKLARAHAELENDMRKSSVEVSNLKKELEETYRTKEADLKNHNKRDMTLVDELAGKNDEIKKLKEENSYLKSEIKQKQGIISKAYERYSNEIIKTRKDVLEVAYRDIEKDNGYVGFKLYVKNALIEAKGNKNEANEVITDAVKFCFNEWDKTQKENEKTIKKAIKEVMSKKFGVGVICEALEEDRDKYTPDFPCGEDSIE